MYAGLKTSVEMGHFRSPRFRLRAELRLLWANGAQRPCLSVAPAADCPSMRWSRDFSERPRVDTPGDAPMNPELPRSLIEPDSER